MLKKNNTRRPWSATNDSKIFQEKILTDQLKELERTVKQIKEKVENLEPRSFNPETKREIQKLKESTEILLTQYKQLSTLPDKLAEQLQEEIKQLRKENEELKAKVERLESTMRTLELGQVMTIFERNLAKFILQPRIKVGRNGGLKYMLECLEKGKKIDESVREKLKTGKGKKINESVRKTMEEKKNIYTELGTRWNDFQSNNINWTEDHEKAIEEVKDDRNGEAHPTKIDFGRVRHQITELYVHRETECLEIIEMQTKLNHLLALGLFSCEFENKVVSFILPGKDGMNISELNKWLSRNKSTEEERAANQRWEKLTDGKKWTNNHEMVLQREMKKLKRDEVFLFEIDFEEAKMHVDDYVSSKDECFEIIDMMKTLPILSGKQWELPKYR